MGSQVQDSGPQTHCKNESKITFYGIPLFSPFTNTAVKIWDGLPIQQIEKVKLS